jgi:hypothetical protein
MFAAYLAYVFGPILPLELALLIGFVILLNLRSLVYAALDKLR